MQNHSTLWGVLSALSSLLLFSCASTHVPSRWLPGPEGLPSNVYGGWVEVKSGAGEIRGELIAVTDDTLFVADTNLSTVASSHILSARLVTYAAGEMGSSVLAGSLLTLSNGVLLMATLPMWLIGGSTVAANRSFEPILDYPEVPLRQFIPYSRFPQGLPADLDRTLIRMKPRK